MCKEHGNITEWCLHLLRRNIHPSCSCYVGQSKSDGQPSLRLLGVVVAWKVDWRPQKVCPPGTSGYFLWSLQMWLRILSWNHPGLGWALNPVTGVLIKEEKEQGYRGSGIPCDVGERNWKEAAISSGPLGTAETRRDTWNRFSLRASRRTQACGCLGFRLLASKENHFLLFFKPPNLESG